MQPRNLSLGVAKQLGLDRPGEGRQARAGALCALACVIFARHLRKEVLKRMGRAGREKKRGKTARLVRMSIIARTKRSLSNFHSFVLKSCLLLVLRALGQSQNEADEYNDDGDLDMFAVFRVASFLCCELWGNLRMKRTSTVITVISHLFCHFRVAPFCDSLESLPQDGKFVNIVRIMIVRNIFYVIAKDQRHATTAMQYNQLPHECIKHVM